MNVTVVGLWHLGSVTAACCARHYPTVGLDFDPGTVAQLQHGKAPVFEPGLDALIAEGLAAGRLRFVTDPQQACAQADVLWVAYDTPVNDQDEPDVAYVLDRVRRCLVHLRPGTLVLLSSQLPVGTCRSLERQWPQLDFACAPENLRLGRALESFAQAERVVVGLRNPARRPLVQELFQPFTPQVLFMRPESAEMTKHALNSFLALSIAFINEVARLCERVGADAAEVAAGLKSEPRIGPRAYLAPGGPFAGGTLAREVVTLSKLAAETGEALALIPAILESNNRHRAWPLARLQTRLGPLQGRVVAVLGLTYTPNTDTLRRSAAIELCRQLLAGGAQVRAFDPAIKELPGDLSAVTLASDLAAAVAGADAAVVCTQWPQFQQAPWAELVRSMRQPIIVDANRFLESALQQVPSVEHLAVGRAP